MNRRPAKWLGGWFPMVVLGLFLLSGLLLLLNQRLLTGDAYPPYSSLRSDPLGTRVLYESLERFPGVSVERNFFTLEQAEMTEKDTLLMLGVDPRALDTDNWVDAREWEVLENRLRAGGRLIVSLQTEEKGMYVSSRRGGRVWSDERDWEEESEGEEAREREETEEDLEREEGEDENENEEEEWFSFGEKMEVWVEAEEFFGELGRSAELVVAAGADLGDVPLPAWRSNHHFGMAEQDSPWEVLVSQRGVEPVVLRRDYGLGEIYLLGDSYFLSNEGLWRDPAPAFLSWLLPSEGRLVFDEVGHGVRETPGVMNLARRYQMHGLFIGGMLFFVLVAWRGSSSLVPGDLEEDRGDLGEGYVAGEDTAAGLSRLLRRGVSKREILNRCLDSWQAGPKAQASTSERNLEEARRIAEQSRKDPVAAYQEISVALHQRQPEQTQQTTLASSEATASESSTAS